MNQHKSNLIRGCIFAILSLLLLCFIFSNSAQPREESAAQSMSIVSILKPLLDPHDRIPEDVFHNAVRKAAHFAEFAALGFSLAGLSDCLPWKRKKQRLAMPLLVSLLVAVTDEVIQIFSPLRGPGVKDVLLDFCGAAFGVACMLVLLLIIRRLKIRNE